MNAVLQQLAGLRLFQSGLESSYNFLKDRRLESTETLYYALYTVMGKVTRLCTLIFKLLCFRLKKLVKHEELAKATRLDL